MFYFYLQEFNIEVRKKKVTSYGSFILPSTRSSFLLLARAKIGSYFDKTLNKYFTYEDSNIIVVNKLK